MQKLYTESVDYIYRFVYSFGLGNEVTEDVVAESFTKAFENIDKFQWKCAFKTWVYKIARNEVYQYFKKKKGALPLDEDKIELIEDKSSGKASSNPKAESEVLKILSKLPRKYAEVLRLRFILGYSIKECAEALNISESNVKVIQNRAIKKSKQ